jgi:hypothetical protein
MLFYSPHQFVSPTPLNPNESTAVIGSRFQAVLNVETHNGSIYEETCSINGSTLLAFDESGLCSLRV